MQILVLQEILANAEKIKEALGDIDGEIICVNSQSQAMDYLNRQAVDMIVTAVHLQSGNVFDFLKWVKGDPVNQNAAFVFFCADPTEVSRYVWPAVQTAALVLGADKYLAMDKFDKTVLRQELIELLERNALRSRKSEPDGVEENNSGTQPANQIHELMYMHSVSATDGHHPEFDLWRGREARERDGHKGSDGLKEIDGHNGPNATREGKTTDIDRLEGTAYS